MRYEVSSDRSCLIDAIGEMEPGIVVTLNEDGAKLFETIHGHKLTQTNFPEYVNITVVLEEEE